MRTAAARVAMELEAEGVELYPGERLNFLLVPGPEKARAWELIDGEIPYDRSAYTELMLRAIDSVVAPLGVDRHTLDTWLLGNAGYWGPPGALPPAGVDIATPLLARSRVWSWMGIQPPSAIHKNRRAPEPAAPELRLAA